MWRQTVTLREVSKEKFVVLKPGYGSRTIFDQLFAQVGIQPNIAFEGEEIMSVMGFVATNLGITLQPNIVGINMKELSCLSISDFPCKRTIGLAWKKEAYLSPVAKRFKEYLINSSSPFVI